MSNWIKKKFQQLTNALNADEIAAAKEIAPMENSDSARLDNIEELKEITIGAITRAVRMLGYGNAVISELEFHSKFDERAVESTALQNLVQNADFQEQLKREFTAKGIAYKEDLRWRVVYNSEKINSMTRVTDAIAVAVLTPREVARKLKARIVATEGITWEPEYILDPTSKSYFIGRGREVKLDKGPKIHNHIAFIGIEEKNEEQYKINSHVSRSHAYIIYEENLGAFVLYRSKFLNDPSHKIKVFDALHTKSAASTSLSQSAVPYVLKDGDIICFNDKVVLEFHLINT